MTKHIIGRVLRMLPLVAFMLFAGSLSAQEWGAWGGGGGTGTDTASVDSNGTWGSNSGSGAVAPKAVYKRFQPPYDSLREIIFYEGIIEDETCETCGADSLYWRTKKFFTNRYGKENLKNKKWVVEDVVGNKMILKVTVPMMVQLNQFNKRQNGFLEYRVAVRFQEGRYKYQFGNFVHVQTQPGLEAKTIRTYHEYYMRVKKGYQGTDQFLLAADREVKEIVEGLKKSLRAPYQPDEDDW